MGLDAITTKPTWKHFVNNITRKSRIDSALNFETRIKLGYCYEGLIRMEL